MISNAEYFAQDQDLADSFAAGEMTRSEFIAARVALADQWAVPATLASQVVDFTAEQRTVLDQIGLLNLTGAVASVGDLPGGAANGDTYLVNNNGHAYLRLTGVWKDLGPYAGRGGVAIFSVEGDPPPDLGVAGDLALDLETGDFYGPKTSGGWGEPVVATGLDARVSEAVSARDAASGHAEAAEVAVSRADNRPDIPRRTTGRLRGTVIRSRAGQVGLQIDERGRAIVDRVRLLAGVLEAADGVEVLRRDGDLVIIPKLAMPGGLDRSTGSLRFSICDESGKRALGIGYDGLVNLRLDADSLAVVVEGVGATPFTQLTFIPNGLARSTGASRWSVGDSDGRKAIAVEKDGLVTLRLSTVALENLAEDLSFGIGEFRGSWTVTDKRVSAELLSGIITQNGWTGRVTQPVAGALDAVLAYSTAAVQGVHIFGQSNAGPSGDPTPTLTTALHPAHAVTFSAALAKTGSSAVNGSTLFDLAPVKDPVGVSGQVATTAAFALEDMARQMGESSPAYFLRSDYYGGEPIETFAQGTTTYTNLMTSIAKADLVVADYGRDYRPNIVFVQGESGPKDRADYGAKLTTLIEDLRDDVFSAVGSRPNIIFAQTNAHDVSLSDLDTVALAHLDVAKAYDRQNVSLLGPLYQCPLYDGFHCTNLGRMMQGELTALAMREVWKRGFFRPLRPKKVTRVAAVITVDFYNPGGPLQLDADWVLAVPNYGFVFKDDSNSATVSSVTITDDSQLQVTLSTTPTGTNKRLIYANTALSVTDDDWASARGQLFASSGVESPYYLRGYAVPRFIRHYCVRFEEPAT